jgi:hypothetical protein
MTKTFLLFIAACGFAVAYAQANIPVAQMPESHVAVISQADEQSPETATPQSEENSTEHNDTNETVPSE